jgi:hypothetical protein
VGVLIARRASYYTPDDNLNWKTVRIADTVPRSQEAHAVPAVVMLRRHGYPAAMGAAQPTNETGDEGSGVRLRRGNVIAALVNSSH